MRFNNRAITVLVVVSLVLSTTAPASAGALAAGHPAGGANPVELSAPLPGMQAGNAEGDEMWESTSTVTLLQGGAFPSAVQLGTAWDGLDRAGSALSAQESSDDRFKAALLAALERHDEDIDVSAYGFSIDMAQGERECEALSNLFMSVVNSNPDLFYVGTAYSIKSQLNRLTRKARVMTLTPTYAYDEESVESMGEQYEAQMADLLSWVPESATVPEKMKAAHDWLVQKCTYDEESEASDPRFVGWDAWNAYGALVKKTAVCQGIALAYRAALNRLDIPSTYLSANGHAWNCAQVDGEWYHVDVTWDQAVNPLGNKVVLSDYFLKSDAKVVALDKQRSPQGPATHFGWAGDIHATSALYDDKLDWPLYTQGSHAVQPKTYPASVLVGIKDGDVKLSAPTFTYTGKAISPKVTVAKNGETLKAGADYDVVYANNVNVGVATVTVTGKGGYKNGVRKSFLITKAANPLKVKALKKTVKRAKLQKKAQKFKAISFTRKAQGKVTYAKVAKGSSAKLSVNKATGKITVKKKTAKGALKIKVKVSAAGTGNYKAGSKTVTVKVKVK